MTHFQKSGTKNIRFLFEGLKANLSTFWETKNIFNLLNIYLEYNLQVIYNLKVFSDDC